MNDIMSFSEFYRASTLDEAAFGSDKIARVVSLYGSLVGREFGTKFYSLGSEEFKGSNGSGIGIRLISPNGIQLRFNFSKGVKGLNQKFTKDALFLSGIDYWDSNNKDFSKPTLNAKFTQDINVVKILKTIIKCFKTNTTGKFKVEDLMTEAAPYQDRLDFMAKNADKFNTKSKSIAYRPKEFEAKLAELGLSDDWNNYLLEIKKGQPEKNTTEENFKKADKKLKDKPYADPKRVFNDIEKLTRLVGKGALKSLIICGLGGVGKTFHVEKTMNELGVKNKDWDYYSGAKWTAPEFYKACLLGRNKTIVFDEADDILQKEDMIMMLKPCLDTSGDNTMELKSRTLSTKGWSRGRLENYCDLIDNAVFNEGKELAWKAASFGKGKAATSQEDEEEGILETPYVPDKFYFNGQMIFISNMDADDIEGAIKSRSIYVDVYLHMKDILQRIKDIAVAKYAKSGEYTEEFVLDFVDKICKVDDSKADQVVDGVKYVTTAYIRKYVKPPTMRTVVLAFNMLKGGMSAEDAADLANMYA